MGSIERALRCREEYWLDGEFARELHASEAMVMLESNAGTAIVRNNDVCKSLHSISDQVSTY
jgi:hypothetical protein